MFELDWSSLKPPEKVLFTMLLVSAVSSVLAVILLAVKLFVEWLNRKDMQGLVTLLHQQTLVASEIRKEITRNVSKVERVAEGTSEAVKKVSNATEKVKQAAERVEQAVIPPNLPISDPRATPRPPEER